MPVDLAPLATSLDARPYGLIVLATRAGDDVRQALWEVLGGCESLYWLGPMTDKPIVAGTARCWLLECPLDERAEAFRSIARRDPHAIHAIGLVDATLFSALMQGAHVGFVTVAEVDADSVDDVISAARAFDVEPEHLAAALLAGIGTDGTLRMVASS